MTIRPFNVSFGDTPTPAPPRGPRLATEATLRNSSAAYSATFEAAYSAIFEAALGPLPRVRNQGRSL